MPSHVPFPSERLSNSSRQRQQSAPGIGKTERTGTGNAKKDGAAQKAAQDVAGLKDYVGFPGYLHVCGTRSWSRKLTSPVAIGGLSR
jgi:hypothetical protein